MNIILVIVLVPCCNDYSKAHSVVKAVESVDTVTSNVAVYPDRTLTEVAGFDVHPEVSCDATCKDNFKYNNSYVQ